MHGGRNGKNIPRTFVVAIASLGALLQSFLPWKTNGVQAIKYSPPVNVPYSKAREEMNHFILRAEEPFAKGGHYEQSLFNLRVSSKFLKDLFG